MAHVRAYWTLVYTKQVYRPDGSRRYAPAPGSRLLHASGSESIQRISVYNGHVDKLHTSLPATWLSSKHCIQYWNMLMDTRQLCVCAIQST